VKNTTCISFDASPEKLDVTPRANQHFVPKLYFRLFTGGDRRIHLLHKKDERIVLNASIKGQCAGHRFYGPDEVEELFNPLEDQQGAALRQIRDLAWSPAPAPLEPHHLARVWEAVLLQRARTELEIKKISPASEALFLEMFMEYLKHAPGIENREAILEHIHRDHIRIRQEPQRVVALSIVTALKSVSLISDLAFHVLRNQTDFPFVFGDSPVVFCNTYYRNVTHRGVLGLQTPGLQIFYPIDSRTMLLLLDDQVYGARYREPLFIDIDKRCDVSQLNALQLHHSLHAVYFADARDQEYVADLWEAHKRTILQPKDRMENRKGWLVDGQPVGDGLYHTFEPHLNIKLALSFIECVPIDPTQYTFRRRSPELYQEHKNATRRAVSAR
jgi:hypothetical protein